MSDEEKKGPVSSGQGRVIASEELFQGKKEVHIWHREAVYRLLITRQGKLILNK